MHERPKPKLDGTPLEICLALIFGDHTPGDAAQHSLRIRPDSFTAGLLSEAWADFEQAAALNRLEDLGRSVELIESAKANLREVALIWLGQSLCPCCLALREQIERGATEEG